MREALLLVFLIIISILVFIPFKRTKDGFVDVNQLHSNFIERQLTQWGDVGISLISAKKVGTLGNSADKMLETVGEKGSYPLRTAKDGLWKIIDKCEAIKTTDCNAFDNPEFRKDCGICLDIGMNSDRVPATGGLVVLADDKAAARQGAHSNFLPEYQATIGFCPVGKMVTTKEECLKLQRQLLCNKNSSFDLPGCSQCYSDTSYSIVDPKTSPGVISDHGIITLIGEGRLTISEAGYNDKNGIVLSMTKQYSYTVRGKEGSRIKFRLSPPANSDEDNPTVPRISGILVGETGKGTFTQDLRRIVLVDEVTGRKPRSRGKATLNGTPVSTMSPGHGQDTATIVLIIPFSFAETTTMESTLCKDAPFVTTQAAAEFLDSDPCYKKGSGPGKFSLECLQGIWEDNSCTGEGKGYPGDATRASALMAGSDGSFLSLNEIADVVYNKALITSTGIDENGVKFSIKDWSEASVFCTGREITSPCDTGNKNSGPLSPECIIHLWNNQSSKKTWQGKDDPIGPTYYNTNSVSLFSEGPTLRSCQTTGTLSPIDPQGARKRDIIKYWQKQGGVNKVKRVMADLHRAANAQRVADDQLSPYFKQCYGDIEMAPRPATVFACNNSAGLPLSFTPVNGTVIKDNLAMTQDYKLDFDLTPTGTTGNWGSIIHFSHNSTDGNGFGCRTPAIWFVPGGMGLHVRIGDSSDLNWGFDNQAGCAVGKTSHVTLECRGKSVRLTIDSNVYTLTQPTYRYSGTVKVYGCNPWYEPAKTRVENLCLQLLGNSTAADNRQNMTYNNMNINGGGAAVNRHLGNLPNLNACIAAGRQAHPEGNYAITYAPGQCWVIGPTDPYDRHFNPARGWTSTYFRPAGENLPGIAGVTRIQLAGGWGTCLNFSQLVALNEKGENISRGRPTEGSGQWEPASHSGRAVDGEEWPRAHPNEYHVSAAACGQTIIHWEVKLDKPSTVSAIILYNRADCCAERLNKFNMHFFNSSGDLIYWVPNMSPAAVSVLKTNSSTNQVSRIKGHDNMYCYSNRYRDLYNAFDAPHGPANNSGALVNHWNQHGKREGRNAQC